MRHLEREVDEARACPKRKKNTGQYHASLTGSGAFRGGRRPCSVAIGIFSGSSGSKSPRDAIELLLSNTCGLANSLAFPEVLLVYAVIREEHLGHRTCLSARFEGTRNFRWHARHSNTSLVMLGCGRVLAARSFPEFVASKQSRWKRCPAAFCTKSSLTREIEPTNRTLPKPQHHQVIPSLFDRERDRAYCSSDSKTSYRRTCLLPRTFARNSHTIP